MEIDLSKLAEPFGNDDLEWRIAQAGRGDKGLWAKVLCYVTNRAIQSRLDEVCGPANWRNEFLPLPNGEGGCLCGISIRIEGEWVTKWDGANNTDIESIKGGLSDAMKRAAVQWGMGRHLYGLGDNWANIHEGGSRFTATKINNKKEAFRWDPPGVKPKPGAAPRNPQTVAERQWVNKARDKFRRCGSVDGMLAAMEEVAANRDAFPSPESFNVAIKSVGDEFERFMPSEVKRLESAVAKHLGPPRLAAKPDKASELEREAEEVFG